MKIEQLEQTLASKGFKKENVDTGIEYSKISQHIALICYIEPGINVTLTSTYKWKDNDVKGVISLSIMELSRIDSLETLFKKTLNDMPEYVGEKNIHIEVRNTIVNTFN